MSEKVSNSFSGGLNMDLGKSLIKDTNYVYSLNWRLTSQIGQSTGLLQSCLGNKLIFSIPDTSNVLQITTNKGTGGVITNPSMNFSIVINGQSITTITATYTDDITLYTLISQYINNNNALQLLGITSAFTDTQVLVWSLLNPLNITITPVITGSITTYNTFIPVNIINYIPAQTNNKIHGWGMIREKFYIFTTNTQIANPTNSVGQIWEMLYDKITFNVTLRLVKNDFLNTSLYYPIHNPGCVEGVYENINIQRIYWTDNFNVLRKINIADPNCFAILVDNLSVFPVTNSSLPILTKVLDGGQLQHGAYNVAYILTNTAGGQSNASPLSARIDIIAPPTSSAFQAYYDQDIFTEDMNKSIQITINDIDTNYNQIEIIGIFRTTLGGVPIIGIIKTEQVPTSGSYTTIWEGNEITTPLTLDEFLQRITTFTTCKGIATEDNRLFPFNVTSSTYNPGWDARAYRFKSMQHTVDLYNGQGQLEETIDNVTYNAPLNADVINKDLIPVLNSPPTGVNLDITQDKYRFLPLTNSLGGQGLNIKYEFGTTTLTGDEKIANSCNTNSPYRFTGPDGSNVNSGGYLYTGNLFPCQKSPYLSGVTQTGQLEELYRCGIVLYDKYNNASFVKWIGDIRFPTFFDFNSNPDSTAQTWFTQMGIQPDFRSTLMYPNNSATGGCYIQVPYVKFTILNTLPPDCKAFEFVMVKRDEQNRTVLTQGLVSQVCQGGGVNQTLSINQVSMDEPQPTDIIKNSTTQRGSLIKFHSPDWLYENQDINTGDTIKIVGVSQSLINGFSGFQTNAIINGSTAFTYGNIKYYDWYTLAQMPSSLITDFWNISEGQTITGIQAGWDFNNFSNNANNTGHASIGCKGIILQLQNNISLTSGDVSKYFAYIQRPAPNQYGGFTYDDRTQNQYISTNSYTLVKNYIGQGIPTFLPDVFNIIFDQQYAQKNWGQIPGVGVGGDNVHTKVSLTIYFPCQTLHNYDIRGGQYVNNTNFLDTGAAGSIDVLENYSCNAVYSNVQDLITFFPQPLNFVPIEEFDTRIYASEVKVNGDTVDSWGIFEAANYYDVEGTYGPLNNILMFMRGETLFFQDHAYGLLQINPQALINPKDPDNSQLILGTGTVITRHDYKSTSVGAKHQSGMFVGDRVVYFFDVINKKIYDYKYVREVRNFIAAPITDEHGISSFMNNNFNGEIQTFDNPYLGHGVTSTYDWKYNDVIFTFKDTQQRPFQQPLINNFTLVFNTTMQTFTGFMSFTPSVYLNNTTDIISPNHNGNEELYIHSKGAYNNWYNTLYPSQVSFYVNSSPSVIKVFDNGEALSESYQEIPQANNTYLEIDQPMDFISTIQCSTPNTTTLITPLIFNQNLKRKEREWRLTFPRLNDGVSRIRDKFMLIQLTYNNPNGFRFLLHYFNTILRKSNR